MPPEYGKVLRRLRKAKQRTLGDVAEVLDISLTYVSDVELGNRAPFDKRRNLILADYLEADPDELLIAAAEWNGAFELDAKSVSPKAQEVGAMLMRGWTHFDDRQLDAFRRIATKKGKAK